MYNEMIVKHLVDKYGTDATVRYCKLHSESCELIHDYRKANGDRPYEYYADYAYDAQWWKQKGEQLQKEYNEAVISKSPESGRSNY